MKKLLFLLFAPLALWAFTTIDRAPETGTVTLVCNIYEVPANFDSLRIYDLNGLAAVQLFAAAKDESGKYTFNLPSGKSRFYGVGFSELNTCKVILGEEPSVSLWANANFMDKARTSGSIANKGLEAVYKRVAKFRSAETEMQTAGLRAGNDVKAAAAIAKQAESLSKEKMFFLDSLKSANALLYRVATLHVHPDLQAEKKKPADAAQFLGSNYFRYADLKDKVYADVPDVYDAFQQFAERLLQSGASSEAAAAMAEAQLAVIPVNIKTHRLALAGLCTGFKNDGPLYVRFCKKYIDTYRNSSLGEIGRLDYEIKKSSTFTPGMEAPDLAGPTPDGGSYSLNQMRGKVVLVDFWASWCGPCRREMPAVKASYAKYKDKGFDILGVSLDREAGAWKKAIESDGLAWHHISDLKGWQSTHAALYSVNSIPATVLLDRNGKIISRNLRGEQLDVKLKEIFGE